ncbi:glycosyltransferase [Synechocystis sp. FACHB-383]|uniref:glycosyltransferase family 2 protein n=1 Tax=Synechocystis sp. FACHB-383 TaxID=2692864 RepID=UPI0016892AC8|nr:glycosyltransferase [Synechocystis sp. FACHB-383]MBD2654453.1 glycosyltransferase [Synechocystis sp. FACHB-383]
MDKINSLQKVTVMITTKNRLDDLKRTCAVLKTLNPAPDEILITADGCTDGTVTYVQQNLPEAKLIINEIGRGSVPSRDRMMREATGDLVLALDDDSYPEQIDCIGIIKSFFEQHLQVAVVHFPQRTDEYPETLEQQDFGQPYPTRSFANSGACLRRDIYLQLPGFESKFFHMYEEPDYGLQCTAAGYQIYYAPILTIRHHYSPQNRGSFRSHHQHARNELWSTLLRCPFPQVILVICYRLFSQAKFVTLRAGFSGLIREPLWWQEALQGLPYCLIKRQPVTWQQYQQWLKLP